MKAAPRDNLSGIFSAEEALRESELRNRTILQTVMEGFWLVDLQGRLKEVNDAYCKMSGYSEQELLAMNISELEASEGSEEIAAQIQAVIAQGKVQFERKHRRKDGSIFDVEISVQFQGELEGLIFAFLQDVTVSKQSLDSLRQSEEKYRSLVESTDNSIYLVGEDCEYLFMNLKHRERLGLSPSQVHGTTYGAYHSKQETDAFRERVKIIFETGRPLSYEYQSERDGNYFVRTLSPVMDHEKVKAVSVISKDVTDEKKAEDLIRNFSQQLLQAQERERQMISCELHDRIAQELSAVKIGFDTLFDGDPVISQEVRSKSKNLSNIIEIAINSVRDLSYELRPFGPDEIDIVNALKMYTEDFSESSEITTDFQSVGMQGLTLGSESKTHLYRLVQEGLNNIRKHAHASMASVKIVGALPNIILNIEDNGIGFDLKERERKLDDEKRLGLRSMRERVELLRGEMRIASRLGKGTKIFIKFPFKEKPGDAEKAYINR
ncbi:MAG: PAS domain S-box protein [Desulfobacterales bacterium]|nr:PAS domain S-box protein [Desulfobacterales bacterium]